MSVSFRVSSSNHHSPAANRTLAPLLHHILPPPRHILPPPPSHKLLVRSSQFHPCLFPESVSSVSVASPRGRRRAKKKKVKSAFQVGLTPFLLVQSEFSLNLDSFVSFLTVFDSKLQLAITFAYELRFRRASTQNAQHEKIYVTTTTMLLCDTQNSQKRPGRSSFCPLKFSDPKIPADLHLYLAWELFLFCLLCHAVTFLVFSARVSSTV